MTLVSFVVAGLAMMSDPSPKANELVMQTGHATAVTDVRFFPSGRRFITAGADMTARIWDTDTGFEIATLRGHHTPVDVVEISPDGEVIATGSASKELFLWNKRGELLRRIEAHRGAIRSLSFHPKGELLASGSADGEVRVWRVKDGSLVRKHAFGPFRFEGSEWDENEKVTGVRYTTDGKSLMAGGGPGLIAIWNADTGAMTALLGLRDENNETVLDGPHSFALSRDGKYMVCGFGPFNKDAYVLDLQAMRIVHRLKGSPDGSVDAVAIAPSGEQVLIGLQNGGRAETRVYELKTGKLVRTHSEDARTIHGIAVAPDGRSYVSVGDAVTRNDMASGRILQRSTRAAWPVMALRSLRDGTVVSGSREGVLHYYDPVGLKRSFAQHLPDLSPPFAWSDDGHFVLGSLGNSAFAWVDTRTGKVIHKLQPSERTYVQAVAVSADASEAFVLEGTGKLNAYELVSGTKRWSVAASGSEVAVFPDGKRLAVSMPKGVRVLDVRSGKTLFDVAVPMKHSARALAINADGSQLAIGGGDQVDGGSELFVFDLVGERANNIRSLVGHESAISALAFSPDGTKLASGTGALYNHERFSVMVFDPRAGKLLSKHEGHSYDITGLAFVGQHLWSSSMDSTVRVHRTDKHEGANSAALLSTADEWVVVDNVGHFDGSTNSGRMVAVRVRGRSNDEAYALDQFALVNNRPDLLLSDMGAGTKEMIAHYKAQYDKRLQKLGLSQGSSRVGSGISQALVSIEKSELKQRQLLLAGKITSQVALKSYQIFVNDVPVFANGGEKVSGTTVAFAQELTLTAGRNKIEVSAIDADLAESLRAVRTVVVEGSLPRDLYYVGFGVSMYQKVDVLDFAHQDALDLEQSLKSRGGFGHIYSKTYLNDAVSRESLQAAKNFVAKARPEDVVVVFVAGHGMHETSGAQEYYYLTAASDPADLSGTAAPFSLIEDIVAASPSRSKLLLLDTCESGELDSSVGGSQLLANTRLQSRGVHKKVNASDVPRPAAYVMAQKDRYIYNDLLRRSGAIVFSSSRGGELSYEDKALKNGLFTDALIEGLQGGAADFNRDANVSVNELRRYVYDKVSLSSDGLQHPTVDRDNLFTEISFPVREVRSR